MSIWVEYYKYEDPRWDNPAQVREPAKWVAPQNVQRRFFDNVIAAREFQSRMGSKGWHCIVKQDGGDH